ncbi:MAG: hypothetical protein ACPGSD_11410 [Flavobacteriales bacterium]
MKIMHIGSLIILVGLIVSFLIDPVYWVQILIVLGLELLCLSLVKELVLKRKSIKLLGFSILGFSILNLILHLDLLVQILQVIINFQLDYSSFGLFVKLKLWFFSMYWFFFQSFSLIKNHENIDFYEYMRSNSFRILVVIVLIFLFLEIPLYDTHPYITGDYHGHCFWQVGIHFH